MNDSRRLFEVSPSAALLLLVSDPNDRTDVVWGWREAGLAARVVRGRKMRTVVGVFDEFAAALQFPQYFGENWGAFNECLCEMEWLAMETGIVIAVVQPAEVLADDSSDQLGVLVRVLTRAAETYARPISTGSWWDRPAVPFHVVLQTSPDDAETTASRWTEAGGVVTPFFG